MLYVLPLVKAAAVGGCFLGAADTLYQWARGRRRRRRAVKYTWDGDRTAKMAITGACVSPLIVSPVIVVTQWDGVRTLLDVGGGLLVTEVMMTPLLLVAGQHVTRYFKPQIPLTIVLTGVITVGSAFAISTFLGHVTTWSSISSLGILGPENLVFTYGMGMVTFAYYCYVHQNALTLGSELSQEGYQNHAGWVAVGRVIGTASAAGLLTLVVFPLWPTANVHMTAGNVFFLAGVAYETLLTYQSNLIAAHRPLTNREQALNRMRWISNGVTLVAGVGIWPLMRNNHLTLAALAQCVAAGSWAFHIVTYVPDWMALPPDQPDAMSVNPDEGWGGYTRDLEDSPEEEETYYDEYDDQYGAYTTDGQDSHTHL